MPWLTAAGATITAPKAVGHQGFEVSAVVVDGQGTETGESFEPFVRSQKVTSHHLDVRRCPAIDQQTRNFSPPFLLFMMDLRSRQLNFCDLPDKL